MEHAQWVTQSNAGYSQTRTQLDIILETDAKPVLAVPVHSPILMSWMRHPLMSGRDAQGFHLNCNKKLLNHNYTFLSIVIRHDYCSNDLQSL